MSFFEKLKNSIGVEETTKETVEEEEQEEKPQKQAVQKSQKIHVRGTIKREEPPMKKSPKKEAAAESPWFEPEGELAVDVYQTNGEIVIQSTIAGVNSDDLDVNIENDVVTISGERRNPNEEEDKSYFYQECYWGPFSRQIILPEEIDTSRIEASMKDGVFTLRLPKLERQKVRKIRVRG
ncbi:MAG: Hsp20/alpha crystallin family protein [Candidatus Wildermuthbacteria bacterium]|nr:Hsp20/alpha crystallin family protein [Candidatus Wildermuthbacteria bacterium]